MPLPFATTTAESSYWGPAAGSLSVLVTPTGSLPSAGATILRPTPLDEAAMIGMLGRS
jgi:hypothetical protein